MLPFADHPHHALPQADVADTQPHQLGNPQPGGVQHFEHRLVAQLQRLIDAGRLQQRIDLRLAQILRQTLRQFGGRQLRGGIVGAQLFAVQVLKQAAHGAQQTRGAGGLVATLHPLGEKRLQIQRLRLQQGGVLLAKPGAQGLQIQPVGGQRIFRQIALKPQRIQELFNQRIVLLLHAVLSLLHFHPRHYALSRCKSGILAAIL